MLIRPGVSLDAVNSSSSRRRRDLRACTELMRDSLARKAPFRRRVGLREAPPLGMTRWSLRFLYMEL